MRQYIDIIKEGYDHTSGSPYEYDMRGYRAKKDDSPSKIGINDAPAPEGLADQIRANTPEKLKKDREEAAANVAAKRAARRANINEGFVKDFLASYALTMLGADPKVEMTFANGEKASLDIQDAKVVAKHLVKTGQTYESPADLWQAISGGHEGVAMRFATLRQALGG